jgi:chemotaxis protein MotB
MPNRVTITGHTAAGRPGTRSGQWSVWDLSVGRAAAIREILTVTGLPDDRFAAIIGRGDTEPMFPDNPWLAANRRVTITLMSEAPPVPFGIKP